MTRDEQIQAHRAKAQEVINSVQPSSSNFLAAFNLIDPSQPHLGLPNNVGELTNLITEAALLPRPGLLIFMVGNNFVQGVPKVMQPVQEAITMSGLEQLKKTQFFINALANEPKQQWNEIRWYHSIPDAIAAAKAADVPIFLEV